MTDRQQLSETELEAVRALLLASTRQQWLLSTIAGSARWFAIVIAGWLAVKGFASEVMFWKE